MPAVDKTSSSPISKDKKLTTIEDIYDEIGGFGKFQVIAIILVTSMVLLFGYSMLLMSYAGYISDFECITQSDPYHRPGTTLYTNRSNQLGTRDGVGEVDPLLNVCSVNGTQCQDFKFLGSKRTVISEVNCVIFVKPLILMTENVRIVC
ncbi:hypothetical protein ElyMa_002708600 [Elysia marginata]|uniref:Uncharacterized protein n=1 Tax=Elysia marginata TaxID=1093978 RepID=A0AAV4HEX0_9GAST|nr:hypothetical protein ElyMa_002708600 [Elysia marginata]